MSQLKKEKKITCINIKSYRVDSEPERTEETRFFVVWSVKKKKRKYY
jgi:hypothetical protein